MKAVQFSSYGDPDVLQIVDAPEPHAGPGTIRIRTKATSVNPVDWKVRRGFMAGGAELATPQIPGADAAGYVDEVGEGVTGVAVGDEVFGLGGAANAESVVLEYWVPKDPAIDWAVAAAAGVAGETAVRGLDLLKLQAGQTVFVDGGAGGVGAAVVQVAKARGLKVIASASADNDGYLREIGATPVRYGDGVVDRVREAAGTEKVDGVYDVAGKTPIEDLIALAPAPDKVVTIANFAAGGAGAVVSDKRIDPQAALAETAALLKENKLVIKIATYPFDRVAETHRISEGGHIRGKLVLLP